MPRTNDWSQPRQIGAARPDRQRDAVSLHDHPFRFGKKEVSAGHATVLGCDCDSFFEKNASLSYKPSHFYEKYS